MECLAGSIKVALVQVFLRSMRQQNGCGSNINALVHIIWTVIFMQGPGVRNPCFSIVIDETISYMSHIGDRFLKHINPMHKILVVELLRILRH